MSDDTTDQRRASRLDRELQYELLGELCNAFPAEIVNKSDDGRINFDDRSVQRNLIYLAEHGLIEARGTRYLGPGGSGERPIFNSWDGKVEIGGVRATAAGMDFLEQDGGLSAILGVVTVRMHQDTLRELLHARVSASELPPEEKATVLERLKSLPAKSIEMVSEKLLERAIDNAPHAATWIATIIQQVAL